MFWIDCSCLTIDTIPGNGGYAPHGLDQMKWQNVLHAIINTYT